jgi:hypothetical protein
MDRPSEAPLVAELLRASLTDLRTPSEWWVWLSADPEDDLELNYEGDGPPEQSLPDEAMDAGARVELQQMFRMHMGPETWYDYMLDCISLPDMLTQGGWDLEGWLLERGIAPGQAFLVRFYNYSSSRSYDGEYDDYYDLEIAGIEPMSAAAAAMMWERWLRSGQSADYNATVDRALNPDGRR